jgi:uncharacterized membrane protein
MTNVNANNAMVAIYNSHTEAEAAVKELQRSSFDMKKLSIVGRDQHTDEHVIGYYNAGDRMKYWGRAGAFWGGIWGMLFGSAFFLIPGVGPLLVAGPLVGWILGALEGAVVVGGLSAIGAGLYSLGIPKNSILHYETALRTGKFVLIAHGTQEETTRARARSSIAPARKLWKNISLHAPLRRSARSQRSLRTGHRRSMKRKPSSTMANTMTFLTVPVDLFTTILKSASKA